MQFATALAHNMKAEAGDITMVDYARTPPRAANDNVKAGPRLVGLMGYGGSGKTTVANILRQQHGFKGPHIKEPLRTMAASLLMAAGVRPCDVDYWLDGAGKRKVIPSVGRSGTEIQQFLGGSFGRDFCRPDLWLSMWLRRVDRILGEGGRVVQESVRYTNEADAIRARGGLIVEVRRSGVGPVNAHESENIPTTPDVVISNDGSIERLHEVVDDLVA